MTIRVSKNPITKTWWVTCSSCPGASFLNIFPQPWAQARDWSLALVVAQWHAALHAEAQCDSCLHIPPLPNLNVASTTEPLVKHSGELYRVTPTGVHLVSINRTT